MKNNFACFCIKTTLLFKKKSKNFIKKIKKYNNKFNPQSLLFFINLAFIFFHLNLTINHSKRVK